MAGPVTPNTASVGGKIPAAWYNSDVGQGIGWLNNPDRCMVYQSVATSSFVTSVYLLVLWDAEQYDTNAMHSLASNTSRINATYTGLYTVNASVQFDMNVTGTRVLNLRKNSAGSQTGGTSLCLTRSASPGFMTARLTCDVQLAAGDYMELFGFQNCGSTLASNVGADVTFMQVRYVATS